MLRSSSPGFRQIQIRLVAVHKRLGDQDHLVVSVHQDDQWLILDNLHHLILQASEETDYEPLYVLDDRGVRQNASLGELSRSNPTASKIRHASSRVSMDRDTVPFARTGSPWLP
jgi:hypothetical protein